MAYDPTSVTGQIRLLINDTGPNSVFTDAEITAFLTLESGSVKRAAAQAIDTIADNEALVAKVITDHDLSMDGAKVADALRKRAAALRAQAAQEAELDVDAGFFEIVAINGDGGVPELTEYTAF